MISDENFKTYISNIDLKMQKFWVPTRFHHYTDHGYKHSRRIIAYLGALLDDYPDLLNQKEQFILRASIYLHDVGMQSPSHARLETKTEYTWEDIETVRKLHHTSSRKMILESIERGAEDEFGLQDCWVYANFIAVAAEYHTELDLARLENKDHLGEEIRLPLLAALIRLGDALDLDHRRVNLENLRRWDIPVESKFHWWAHHYVSSVHIAGGKISVRITFPEGYQDDPVLDPVLDEFKKKIKNSIDKHYNEVYEILWNCGIPLYRGVQIKTDYLKGRHEPIPQDLVDYVRARITGLAEIVVSPNYGTPGSTITITGSHFTQIAGTKVTITMNTIPKVTLVVVDTDADGSFKTTFVCPPVDFQTYTITATDEYFIEADDAFKVGLIALIINPTFGEARTRIVISGIGFAPGFYNLKFGDILYEDHGTVVNEAISDIFYVPNVLPGIYDVTVIDSDENELTVQFIVTG